MSLKDGGYMLSDGFLLVILDMIEKECGRRPMNMEIAFPEKGERLATVENPWPQCEERMINQTEVTNCDIRIVELFIGLD
jgi:hypothetical protein